MKDKFQAILTNGVLKPSDSAINRIGEIQDARVPLFKAD